MKALVIGATGLIGSHAARAPLAAGHEVRGMRSVLGVRRARAELDLPQTAVDIAIQDALAWFRGQGEIA